MEAIQPAFIFIASIVSVTLLRLGFYLHYTKKHLIQATEEVMEESVPLQLNLYTKTSKLAKSMGYTLTRGKNREYVLHDELGKFEMRGCLTSVYIELYNKVKLLNIENEQR